MYGVRMTTTNHTVERVGIILGVAIAAVCLIVLALMGPEPTTDATTHQGCEEDMPCFDCDSMGNLICGDGR